MSGALRRSKFDHSLVTAAQKPKPYSRPYRLGQPVNPRDLLRPDYVPSEEEKKQREFAKRAAAEFELQ